MIGYATIGVSDMERAKSFYVSLLADMDARVLLDMGRICFIGQSMSTPMLAICTPYDGEPSDPGNGNMMAFQPGSKAGVDALYAKAIELGAASEGEPGQRIPDKFYGGYIRDPDHNKVAFYHFG